VSTEKPRRLGRGLEALIGATQTATVNASELQRIATSRIRPNPYQPRREFNPEALAELEASIRANGLLQPITVRRKGDSYELVAGERRLRAVTNLQWKEIPAVIRDFDDQTLLVLALVENLQRSDLNAIEEARGYQRLLGEFSLTHQEVADAVGKDRSTITNLLRVLTLPTPIQQLVESGKLSAGHARALAGIGEEEAIAVADQIIADGLSVRQTEQRVRLKRNGSERPRENSEHSLSTVRKHDPAVRQIEDQLRHYLQTDVQIELSGDSKGMIRVSFYSPDDLERLMELIVKNGRDEFR
jgi:ParB family transcriptional regulator, chromosome partitioning protein